MAQEDRIRSAAGADAVGLALAALAIGVLGDALLRRTPWGINVVIWGVVLGAAVWVANRRAPAPVLVALLLGEACQATFVWRDTPFLQAWDFLALLAGLSLATAHAAGVSLFKLRIRDGILAAVDSALRAVSQAAVLLARDIPWERFKRGRHWGQAPAIAAGLGLAVPIVLVFGGLLRSADPQFASLTDRLWGWDFPTIVSHLALTAFLAWITAGYLYGIATQRAWLLPPPEVRDAPRLKLPHIAIPLGALALMFLVFAGMQAEYLFGGADTLLRTTGLTVAEYARHGFFELVTVAALVLALLLAAHAAIDRDHRATLRGYRLLAVALIGLVGVLMVSALVRMRLYVANFGLSEERIYATAFMLWVGAVLAWFAATVLRERAARFGYGAVIAGFATLLALGVLNPQALIVRTNVARAASGTVLDAAYLRQLGADAVPGVVAAWPGLDSGARCELWKGLQRWTGPAGDWRTWNLSRSRARQLVATLDAPSCPAADAQTQGT